MGKIIKDFNTTAEMQNYVRTAEGGKSYLLRDKSGEDGIGTTLTSGKRIVAFKKNYHDYLTFTAEEANSRLRVDSSAVSYKYNTLEYSTDNGYNWVTTTGGYIGLTNIGDSVMFRGISKQSTVGFSYATFAIENGKMSASGSIMSLQNMNPDDKTIIYDNFKYLFKDNTRLTSVENLVLPATTLASNCYEYMFRGCTSLTQAPELPATTLAAYCYQNMFQGCTSLTSAPELPATTLAAYCYQNMFQGCTSLTSAPELPATTLVNWCYNQMFQGCSSLNDVTINITNWNTSQTSNWLSGVAATGTLHNLGGATNIPTDSTSGCPTGWTIVNN